MPSHFGHKSFSSFVENYFIAIPFDTNAVDSMGELFLGILVF